MLGEYFAIDEVHLYELWKLAILFYIHDSALNTKKL